MTKFTVVLPDGTTAKRNSPRPYTHALALRWVRDSGSFQDSRENAPADATDIWLTDKGGFYNGKQYPVMYHCIVARPEPMWKVLSWHQGPVNAEKARRSAMNGYYGKYCDQAILVEVTTTPVVPRKGKG